MRCPRRSPVWSAASISTSTTRSVRSSWRTASITPGCSGSRAGTEASGPAVEPSARRHRRGSETAAGPACGVDDGQGDYLNCPLTRDEYERFYDALVHAESATVHDFDKERFFEGCLPIEVMAHRGVDTLRFGPMKPVGLVDPNTGREPYAVVQLRQDNLAGDHYSLVGFQTQIKWGDQANVLRLIPGLEHAEFVRFGMVHRNTYVNGPTVLSETWQVRARPTLFFAGQMSGVEGYVESAASGLAGRSERRGPRQGAAGRRAATHDRDRRAGVLRLACRPGALRAVEHHLRHHGAAGAAAKEQAGAQVALAERAIAGLERLARCPGVGRRRRRMTGHLQNFLQFLRLNRNVSPEHGPRVRERSVAVSRPRCRSRGRHEPKSLMPASLDRTAIRAFSALCTGRGSRGRRQPASWLP